MANRNIYSVAQVNSYIKNMFAQDFMLRQVSIKGEVSNCKYHTSGHIYFTIKDAGAAMNAIMFAGSRAAGLSFHMKEGDQVIVTGSVEVYEKTGAYQLYAKKIELDGEGNLYLKFEQLKHELEEMGMFAAEYKQPIPQYAGRIGVVTARRSYWRGYSTDRRGRAGYKECIIAQESICTGHTLSGTCAGRGCG